MSYLPYRDNPDIDNWLTVEQKAMAATLSDRIDHASAVGIHADQCACAATDCRTLRDLVDHHEARSDETIAWLFAEGMLDLRNIRFILDSH